MFTKRNQKATYNVLKSLLMFTMPDSENPVPSQPTFPTQESQVCPSGVSQSPGSSTRFPQAPAQSLENTQDVEGRRKGVQLAEGTWGGVREREETVITLFSG